MLAEMVTTLAKLAGSHILYGMRIKEVCPN